MITNVLLATHNVEKVRIVGSIIKRLRDTCVVESLSDVGIVAQYEEHGSLIARATSKATFYAKLINHSGPARFDWIMGIDDGIAVPRLELDSAESEVLTEFILAGMLNIGDTVIVREAFALFDFTDKLLAGIASVPFRYVGNPLNKRRDSDAYPLKWVLSRGFDDIPLSELEERSIVEYYLPFFEEPLGRVFACAASS